MGGSTDVTVTERKIGATTYTVISKPSKDAKDTLHIKIEKLILKDINMNNLNSLNFENL